MDSPWEIVQVFNNNVVLAQQPGGKQSVLVGTGIGFGARRGYQVDPAKIHEVFSPLGPGRTAHLATLLSELPAELLTLARELADVASLLCGITVTDPLVIMLADHINAAIDRAVKGISLPNPLQWEMRQFYPREYEFGLRSLALIKQSTGIQLEEAEAAAIGQHAVNAQFAGLTSTGEHGADSPAATFAVTAKMTDLLGQVLDIVEASVGDSFDRSSMATARFITHLRYLLQRLLGDRNSPHEPAPGVLKMAASMELEHPKAFKIASLIVIKLESALDTKCSEDEVLYLTLHVARLMMKS